MEESAKTAREYRERLEKEKAKAVEKAQAEARAILQEARDTADRVFAELNDMRRRQEKEADWLEQNQRRSGLLHQLNEAENALGAREEVPAPPPTRPAQAGDTVELVKMGTRASVIAVNKDGSLQLQAGILKITAKQEEVRVVEDAGGGGKKQAAQIAQRAEHKLRALGASPEVDLRGMMTDEAILAAGPLPGQRRHGPAGDGDRHPRQGHRRGAQGGAGAPQAQQVRQVLPPRPLRRGGGRRHGGGAEVRPRAGRISCKAGAKTGRFSVFRQGTKFCREIFPPGHVNLCKMSLTVEAKFGMLDTQTCFV